MSIARDGYTTIFITLIICGLLIWGGYRLNNWATWPLYVFSAVLLGLILNFFRDPERTTPQGEHLMISPADGKVVLIKPVEKATYIDGPATQVSIFLSPLDVHVNRVPVSGKVEYVKYHPGEYLVAWHEKSSELNERSEFGVLHSSGTKIFFKQITGAVARRIVYRLKEGDVVTAGERFGMMKFGSRMDILVPANVKILVKVGDVTVAGESIIGEIQ
jgi:phosphatidylserine decarboxylase